MNERRLKGGVILGYLDFIKRQWGQKGLDECLNALNLEANSFKHESFYSDDQDEKILYFLVKSLPQWWEFTYR